MPYKDPERQKAAMRQIMKRYTKERTMALRFIQEKGLVKEFTDYVKNKDDQRCLTQKDQ